MTGYQEILTDPSYAGQIVTFTFPHIGNVGANDEDIETVTPAARAGACGVVVQRRLTEPANYRAATRPRPLAEAPRHRRHGRRRHPRADRADPRQGHAERASSPMTPTGRFDLDALKRRGARPGPGWTASTSCRGHLRPALRPGTRRPGSGTKGYGRQDAAAIHVVAVDYGVKRNILRLPRRRRRRGHRGAGHGERRGHSGAEAGRRLPVQRPRRSGGDRRTMRCRSSRSCSRPTCRCSASASAIRCWRWRSAARPRRCTRATTAPIIRSRTTPPARSRSCR